MGRKPLLSEKDVILWPELLLEIAEDIFEYDGFPPLRLARYKAPHMLSPHLGRDAVLSSNGFLGHRTRTERVEKRQALESNHQVWDDLTDTETSKNHHFVSI